MIPLSYQIGPQYRLCPVSGCGVRHSPRVDCGFVRRWLASQAANGSSPPREQPVVHEAARGSAPPVTTPPSKAGSRHGKYADAEARKAYRRDWMRRKRAANHA